MWLWYLVAMIFGTMLALPLLAFCREWCRAYFYLKDFSALHLTGYRGNLAIALLFALAFLGGFLIGWSMFNLFVRYVRELPYPPPMVFGFAGSLFTAFVIPAIVGERIRRQARNLSTNGGPLCIACDYSLRGLPVENDHITCPECGLRQSVEEIEDRRKHTRKAIASWDRFTPE